MQLCRTGNFCLAAWRLFILSDFDLVVGRGLQKIRNEDGDIQRKYVAGVAQARGMDADALWDVGAVFIPNDGYLAAYCGPAVKEYGYDCYGDEGLCKWNNNLVVPITDVAGKVVAIGGFNPFVYLDAKEHGSKSVSYYKYSNSTVYKKGRYLYSVPGVLEKSIREGYAFLVDGLFDCITLSGLGFNALALLGSFVSPEIIVQLRFIGRIILIADNDTAGIKLYETLKKQLRGLELFKQNIAKDIDDALKSEERGKVLNLLHDVAENGFLTVNLIRVGTKFS